MPSNKLQAFTPVFKISASIILILVIIGVAIPDTLEYVTNNVQSFISTSFGWYYLIVVTFFVLINIILLFSPVGRIKLGKIDDKPDFSRPTWIAMLFSAGMGIGLVFFGAAEPISHYAIQSPTGETGTNQAIRDAMQFTFLHYGIHAWAVYGIVALILAYFNFRHDKRGLISQTLSPLLGKKSGWPMGKYD
ncbi:BCCT family transporter [Pueribacillus theae]|uniref:BCCT family transporter n=1 Tax=Pueribacillus theae TaxID=2171751 RepID=UPI0026B55A8B